MFGNFRQDYTGYIIHDIQPFDSFSLVPNA